MHARWLILTIKNMESTDMQDDDALNNIPDGVVKMLPSKFSALRHPYSILSGKSDSHLN
jgi:hypothetical protein